MAHTALHHQGGERPLDCLLCYPASVAARATVATPTSFRKGLKRSDNGADAKTISYVVGEDNSLCTDIHVYSRPVTPDRAFSYSAVTNRESTDSNTRVSLQQLYGMAFGDMQYDHRMRKKPFGGGQ